MSHTNTVILGSGIIGLSTAYYLSSTHPASSIHLVDPSPTLFASASGFAGGFLAADWFSPHVAALGKLSFEEHQRLAKECEGEKRWGYARSSGVSYTSRSSTQSGKRGDDWLRDGRSRADSCAGGGINEFVVHNSNAPRWLTRSKGDEVEIISEDGSTAQVDPLRLCKFLLQICKERGVQLHHPARATSIGKDLQDELSSIRILNTETHAVTELPCTNILIAAGAWSPQVFSTLFPSSEMRLPITSLAGHSLVVRSPRWGEKHEEKGCHAIFTTDEEGYSPEIFSRRGGEIYVAGLNSTSLSLPALATESKIDEKVINSLQKTAKRLLGSQDGADDLEIIRKGLCFRPVTKRGTPILSRISDADLGEVKTKAGNEGGVWIAAGHGPWGISMSLGTGIVMAEMILGKSTSADLSGLSL